ncbi:alpha/beta hydrolase [Kitasatospora purpeofusca]|uniref:alpha/beta hydrolase n=1 Tax=Kitasatospora purpeofusca TaxID=67352 RepID=UPI0004BF3922|nr:alpha/beta hydrolase [Kitasatospora purpeofusca]
MAIDRPVPQLVFVHGIGGPRDPEATLAEWKQALAEGAQGAGLAPEAEALIEGRSADCSFAYYGDLFASEGAQGADSPEAADEEQAAIMLALMTEFLDELLELPEHRQNVRLRRLRRQLGPLDDAQGVGHVGRLLATGLASVGAIPGLHLGARALSRGAFLRILSQPGRYLRRGYPDAAGLTLDRRIRDRILARLDPSRPAIVVAHSLGTVVALEALSEYPGPVPLFVTLGSPITTHAVVWPLLRPRPPATPATVAAWADFRDSDDLVVPKRRLAEAVVPNARGVGPVSDRMESALLWPHDATVYLRRREVAATVLRTLAEPASRA